MRHLRLPAPATDPNSLSVPDVPALTIAELNAGYDRGDFRPSDIAWACLARIARLEPRLNAFIVINEAILADAEKMDAAFRAGQRRGPLHGVPVVIKDNMNQAGFRTTAGYAGFAADDRVLDPAGGVFNGVDLFPTSDATIVARLKEAGALIVGKSNLPDFGLDGLRADSSYNGDTLNPYNAKFAPGASSTGSATAVSAGFGTVALGTDTAGSILFPASAQSLVGLKPSFGLVPIDGVFPGLSSHHDVAGPIAKTVYDTAALLDVIAGPTEKDPRTLAAADAGAFRDGGRYLAALRPGALNGKRIGLFEPGQWAPALDPVIQQHYERMVAVIQSLGAQTVDNVFADTDWKERWDSRPWFVDCNSYLAGVDAFLAGLGGDNPASRAAFKARAGFDIGTGTTAPLYGLLADPRINVAAESPKLAALMETAANLRKLYEDILATKSIDALLMPRSVTPLPDLGGDTAAYLGDQVVGTQINEMGLPVITLPAGFLADGRPIAIDIVGRKRFTESELLGFAFDFEQATLFRRPPALEA
mgnify:CR=1 FL=1